MADQTLTIFDIHPGTRFSFEVHPTSIIGNNFNGVKMVAIYGAEKARREGVDIESLHANIYPTLPAGLTEDDPYSYSYFEIQQPNGDYKVIGVPWIKSETLVVSSTSRVTMVFDDVTPIDVERMIESLSAIGKSPTSVVTDR